MLVLLLHWMTPDATAAALASNTPETGGKKGREMDGLKERTRVIYRKEEKVDVCAKAREVCQQRASISPETHWQKDR